MNLGTSTYLNLLRLIAAITVVLCHSSSIWTPGHFVFFSKYGQQAVLVFFVLSGYVIAWVSEQKEITFIDYASSRAARMYSVVVPALLLTFLLDGIGRHLAPDFYYNNWGYSDKNELRQFFRSLLFMNEIWWSHSVPGSNNAYWSLGYEVPYYVAYALLIFAPRGFRILGMLIVMCIFGPRVAALFLVWLLGVSTYRWRNLLSISSTNAAALWLASTIAVLMIRPIHTGILFEQKYVSDFLIDYIISICIALNILGAYHFFSAYGKAVSSKTHKFINWVAGATFTIYLLHFPVGQFLVALLGKKPSNYSSAIFFLISLIIILFIIAQVTERHKKFWRLMFTAYLLRLNKFSSRFVKAD